MGDTLLLIIRSHKELAGAEIELAQRGNHLKRLREVLAELRPLPLFDYMLLDCPPSLGVIMTSGWCQSSASTCPWKVFPTCWTGRFSCPPFRHKLIYHIPESIRRADGVVDLGVCAIRFPARDQMRG